MEDLPNYSTCPSLLNNQNSGEQADGADMPALGMSATDKDTGVPAIAPCGTTLEHRIIRRHQEAMSSRQGEDRPPPATNYQAWQNQFDD
jgi:hypothetical protein